MRSYKYPRLETPQKKSLPKSHSHRLERSTSPELPQKRVFPKSHSHRLESGTPEFQQYRPLSKPKSLRLESGKTEFRSLPKPHSPPLEGRTSPEFQQHRSLDKAHSRRTQDLAGWLDQSRPEQPGRSSFESNLDGSYEWDMSSAGQDYQYTPTRKRLPSHRNSMGEENDPENSSFSPRRSFSPTSSINEEFSDQVSLYIVIQV